MTIVRVHGSSALPSVVALCTKIDIASGAMEPVFALSDVVVRPPAADFTAAAKRRTQVVVDASAARRTAVRRLCGRIGIRVEVHQTAV